MKEQTLLLTFFLLSIIGLKAQINVYEIEQPEEEKPLTKTHQWEMGLHAGHFFSAGNIDFIPGFGTGLHIRRATDYVFSIRMDLMYGSLRGEDPGNTRSFQNKWISGSLQGIASLNNLKWNNGERRSNFFAFGGIGANSFEVELTENDVTAVPVEQDVAMHADMGAGIAFKINESLNVGIEHKFTFVFGGRSDLPDGVQTFSSGGDNRGTFRDLLNYTSVRINFNLGKNATSEPLYWVNPLDSVMNEVNTVKKEAMANKEAIKENTGRPGREPELEPIILESDRIAEEAGESYMEESTRSVEQAPGKMVDSSDIEENSSEPTYSSTNPEEETPVIDREEVMAEVEKMVEERLKEIKVNTSSAPTTINNYLLLPTVYFDNNSIAIKDIYLEPLQKLADIINQDSELKVVVIGHADQTGAEEVNDQLSYERALTVITHLMLKHEVNRDQLILHWKGEKDPIVGGSHAVNRRVTFEKAIDEQNMDAPNE